MGEGKDVAREAVLPKPKTFSRWVARRRLRRRGVVGVPVGRGTPAVRPDRRVEGAGGVPVGRGTPAVLAGRRVEVRKGGRTTRAIGRGRGRGTVGWGGVGGGVEGGRGVGNRV